MEAGGQAGQWALYLIYIFAIVQSTVSDLLKDSNILWIKQNIGRTFFLNTGIATKVWGV